MGKQKSKKETNETRTPEQEERLASEKAIIDEFSSVTYELQERLTARKTRTVRTKRNRNKVLNLIATGACSTVTQALKQAKISSGAFYLWKAEDATLEEDLRKAFEVSADPLKSVAYDHALNGWMEEVFQGGKSVGFKRCYDHSLLLKVIEMRDKSSRSGVEEAIVSLADELKLARKRTQARELVKVEGEKVIKEKEEAPHEEQEKPQEQVSTEAVQPAIDNV